MIRIASRTRLHSTAEVTDAVREALEIADAVDLAPADRDVLLPGILVLVAQHHVELEQVGILGTRGPGG